jgi:amino acid adenylation domain-containing protein
LNARLNVPAVRFKRVEFDPFAGAQALAYTASSTEPQQELWNASQLGADASCAFNECISLRFDGSVDVDALKRALTTVVQRNEALRTTFAPGGEQFCVAEEASFDFRMEDRSPDSLHAWRHDAVSLQFDLVHGPLFRAWLARTSASQYELILSAHHIVCDGWSMGVIVSELAEIYSARVEMRAEVLDQPQEIVEYAELQSDYLKSQEHKSDEAYWLSRFKDDIPALDLPLDRPRPPSRGFASEREDLWLPTQSVQAFRKMAAAHGCSLSAAAQAVFQVLLMRLTGQSSIVVGMPAAGQAMFGRESLVGHCVNLLPIRAELDPAMTFADLLKKFRETLHGAFDHQKYTYGEMLKRLAIARDPSRMPLVCVMFNLDPGWTPAHHRFSGLRVEIRSNPRAFENFELFVNCVGKDGGLILEAQYKTELFERQTILGWMSAYLHLIEQFARDPGLHIGKAPMLNDAEFARVIRQWNATDASLDNLLLAHEAISAQALRTPERTAVIDATAAISYRELEARSNQLARYLLERGVRRGSLTGVAVDRGIDLMVALLGVLKTGSAYVPLDPDYPTDRLEYMLRMSKTRVVVTDSVRKTQLPLGDAQAVCMDTDWAAIAKFPDAPITSTEREPARREDVAYVIFTSGSTGLPKGVQVLHLGMANFLRSMQREPGIGADDVLLAVTTLSFDIAVLELYLPLMSGSSVVIASRDDAMDAHKLADLIAQKGITLMQATPATWRMLLAAGWQGEKRLKALCGGEALTRDLSTSLLSRIGELWNMYGPTETTVWSTCKRIESAQEQISIGKPLDNTQVYILNDAGMPQPPGAAGELFIAGDGVALGYLGRDELTAERFSADPFRPGNRMYRTGDLGRWRSDGMLECLGRNDGQVKVRGFRIELGEIEAVLMGSGLLSECSVIVREDTPGDQRLVAYFASDRELRPDELKASIQKKLPAYMVPQNWLQMPSLPKTLNGKIDRKRLPAPGAPVRSTEKPPSAPPKTPTEQFLHDIWKEVLKREDFGVQDDFFLLGGHSLLATQLLARIQRAGRHAPTLRELFHMTTIEQLARWIDQQAPVQQVAQIAHQPGRTSAPLSPMQLRVWYLEQINPGTATYNLPALFRFKGSFDAEALQSAWVDIVARHAALRTRIVMENGEAVQRIEPSLSAELPLVAASESEMLARAAQDAATPFDLAQAPLLRGTLFRLDAQTHALYFVAHHLIWDGWSFDVFLRELKELYEAHSQRRAATLPQLQISYGDFCQWQREEIEGSASLAREKAFWLKQLSGTLPVLDLPTDRPRPAQMSFAGASREFHWDKAFVSEMTEFARSRGATLQMFLLAGFKVLLSRLANLADVIVGAPIQGRTMRETEDLIGFFVNTLVLRTAVDADAGFATVLERVRGTCLDAYSHQQMPFEILVESLKPRRDLSRTPIFQCFFTYQDVARREWKLGGTSVDQINVHTGVVPTDLSLWVKVGNDGLVGAFDYSTALFDESTISGWVEEYVGILRKAVRQPETKVSAFLPQLRSDVARTNAEISTANIGSSRQAARPSAGSAAEEYLLGLWRDLLGVDEIRPTDNFFDLGGHSLLSMQMIARIEREKGKRLSPRLILMSSLTQIASELAGEAKPEAAAVAGQREAVPFFFASGLFGTHHRPRSDSQIGVLICAPIAQEYMRTHWLFRQLANQLVREGMHVMRFDYTGCGDSRGASLSGGPAQWTLDVQAAVDEFRKRSGIRHLVVIGARMGAYLAAAAVPEADLILWDPIESGEQYLSELEAVHREKFPGSETSQQVGLGGFEFPESLRNDIAALKLDAVLGKARKVRVIRSAELGENAGWQNAADWYHAVLSGTILQALRQARAGMTP